MITAVQVAIAGEAAEPAVSELMGMPGLSVSYEAQTQKEGTMAVIATIVGIAGGTVALAEQIRKWYQEWKKSQSGGMSRRVGGTLGGCGVVCARTRL